MGTQKPINKHSKLPKGKRFFDVVFSVFVLLMTAPIMLLAAAAIAVESKGPVIYVSKRVGWGYDIFDFYKFRTMFRDADKELNVIKRENAYANGNLGNVDKIKEYLICPDCDLPESPCSPLLYIHGYQICENKYLEYKRDMRKAYTFIKVKNDPRITKVGKILRATHIDELPQFINVLKGDMSVVGNRPLPTYEAENLTTDMLSYRFLAPAGITGLWQASGSNKPDAEERMAFDNKYYEKQSWQTDLIIILKTFPSIFRFSNNDL